MENLGRRINERQNAIRFWDKGVAGFLVI